MCVCACGVYRTEGSHLVAVTLYRATSVGGNSRTEIKKVRLGQLRCAAAAGLMSWTFNLR